MCVCVVCVCGPGGSSVGKATDYAWTVRESNPGGDEIFRTCPDRPWRPPSLLCDGYRAFPGGKERPGRAADRSPPSSAAVMEEYSYTSTHPLGHTGPVMGSLYLLPLYIYIYNFFLLLANLSGIVRHYVKSHLTFAGRKFCDEETTNPENSCRQILLQGTYTRTYHTDFLSNVCKLCYVVTTYKYTSIGVSNLRPARLCYAPRCHTCKLCIYIILKISQ